MSSLCLAVVTACWGHTPWTPQYACLILVLVHMFDSSSSTHVSFQSSKLHLSKGYVLAIADIWGREGVGKSLSNLKISDSYFAK